MLIINLPETSRIIINVGAFTGRKFTYNTEVMHFLDMMGYKYAFVAGEIHLIDKINDKKKKKDLAESFDIFKTKKGLPSWLDIEIK